MVATEAAAVTEAMSTKEATAPTAKTPCKVDISLAHVDDLDEIVQASIDGFGKDAMLTFFMPNGPTEKAQRGWRWFYEQQLRHPANRIWKATRPGTSEIIGMLSLGWVQRDESGTLLPPICPMNDLDNPFFADTTIEPDFNLTGTKEIVKIAQAAESKFMAGRTYIIGMNLFIIGSLQNAGIGRQLVAAGMEWAKEQGLPIFCLASPAGSLLYRKLGFKELSRITLDPSNPDRVSLGMILDAD
ncbi:uncharacterized protein L969DRAFT_46721 [Mixia osmundae IAM 14324]|uniref:N-acetyltransferase domain-containing protein n=1 Tax=Mixia osmundae (strain CBS 9802 / IAM 14324 / JCM 22182 / KY 12970) TaxID=764103 RepID=G7E657_MIXOS|nr:uncharacterized protein L969DRAFT_46721 [Mixia osmundae IAM 14324]KEI40529.1 hypothetical protein L969DRAFT_46721 [Mixia osmundae IAM 14324]GAA98317.1 hypothetical protein E5Q_05002 [Mixia osmundae IAM 14324]